MHSDSSRSSPVDPAVVSMAVDNQIGSVPIYNFSQTRCTHEWEYFRCLALYGIENGRIVQHDYPFLGS